MQTWAVGPAIQITKIESKPEISHDFGNWTDWGMVLKLRCTCITFLGMGAKVMIDITDCVIFKLSVRPPVLCIITSARAPHGQPNPHVID